MLEKKEESPSFSGTKKSENSSDSTDDNIVLQYLKDFKAVKCLYCFQDDPKFLCQCKDCKYYFCNNIHRKASHIIIHLKQCEHKKVSLNPFDDELACENCRKKDIFELYFKEMEDCMRNIKRIKGAKGTESYFNHIDFILESIFGVKVYLGN